MEGGSAPRAHDPYLFGGGAEKERVVLQREFAAEEFGEGRHLGDEVRVAAEDFEEVVRAIVDVGGLVRAWGGTEVAGFVRFFFGLEFQRVSVNPSGI